MVAAQGGNAQALDKFELLPNATGMREITSPRAGYISSIDAEDIGVASNMIGRRARPQGRRDRSRGRHHSRSQDRREGGRGRRCCAGSTTRSEDRVDEAAEMVEDAFRISAQKPDERKLISGSGRLVLRMGRFTGLLGIVVDPGRGVSVFHAQARHQAAHPRAGAWGCSSHSRYWY